MSGGAGGGPSLVLMALLAGFGAWTVIVLVIVTAASDSPGQRALMAGPLLGIGALLLGMGYLSTLRRRAIRVRQESIDRVLEMRRRERPG